MPRIGLDLAEIKSARLIAWWRKHHKNEPHETVINSPSFCSFNNGRRERSQQSRVSLISATMFAVSSNMSIAEESYRARFLAARSADLTRTSREGAGCARKRGAGQ
jgi:hypothetical protein